jgi:serine/threonine-protein kinase
LTEEAFRDGGWHNTLVLWPLAVKPKGIACELTDWKEDWSFDTLAAAYAEAGDFENAVKWQQKATDMADDEENAVKWQQKATDMADDEEKEDYQSRLDLYKAGKPYREELKK